MKHFFLSLLCLVTALSFTGCKDRTDYPDNDNATLNNTRWEYTMDETNSMYFEFEASTFSYHDVASAYGFTLDTWYKGTFLLKGTKLTLKYKEASSDDLKDAMKALPTTATLSGNTILYNGHNYTKDN